MALKPLQDFHMATSRLLVRMYVVTMGRGDPRAPNPLQDFQMPNLSCCFTYSSRPCTWGSSFQATSGRPDSHIRLLLRKCDQTKDWKDRGSLANA